MRSKSDVAITYLVGEYLAAVERRGRTPLTVTNYRGHLQSMTCFLDERPPTIKLLRAWIDDKRRRGYAKISILGAVVAARAFFRWAEKEGYISSSPAENLEKPNLDKRLPKSIQPHVVAQLLGAADAGPTPERDRALLLFLLDTGVRRTAAAKLKPEDLDFSTSRARVIEKGNVERDVFFSRVTREALRAWLAVRGNYPVRPESRESVFLLSSHGLYNRLDILAAAAGVKHLSPHILRHTCAVFRVLQGCDAASLQNIMGWSDIRMAVIYTGLSEEQIRQRTLETSPLNLVPN